MLKASNQLTVPSIHPCHHFHALTKFAQPKLSQAVHREECTRCFDDQDGALGIDVCLNCYNGGCLDEHRRHALLHFQQSEHAFSLNVKRRLKPKRNEEEPPLKRLAVLEEREEDKYDFQTVVRCWECGGNEVPEASTNPKIAALIQSVMTSMSSARQSEVKAWEEEILACEHTLTLQQPSANLIPASGLAHCAKCELTENLWLCLTCGSLGCGRQQLGGVRGNGHGLQHFEETHHPVSVKLGTITAEGTAEGTADIYCYPCNDTKLDPSLQLHLSTFGINVTTQTKTEKTMTELQIEQNLKYEFSLTGEDGKSLDPLTGPGLTGLRNLGNSCYMASVLQTIFSLPPFRQRYSGEATEHHASTCPSLSPSTCLECQMLKLADGLLSGRYSLPAPSLSSHATVEGSPVFQLGLKPTMFKALIGKGHEEFSTMRQQDSEEFFTHLIKTLRQDSKKRGLDASMEPIEVLRFGMEQRLQCQSCKGVRYRVDEQDSVSVPVPAEEMGKDGDGKIQYATVELTQCFDVLTGTEELDYHCPSCKKTVVATKHSRFATFPDVLVVHAKKFQLVNWVPQKLDIPIVLPTQNILTLDAYVGRGKQEGEEDLPDEATNPTPSQLPTFDQGAMAQLSAMGFSEIRCQKALLATGGIDPEAAMEWLFMHIEDPDIDAPLVTTSPSSSAPNASPEQISTLGDMGFTAKQATKALRETGNDMERAVEWLFSHPDDTGDSAEGELPTSSSASTTRPGGSPTLPASYRLKAFISHKGPSVHSGHYVTHIYMDEGWVLFNDEKVVKASEEGVTELMGLAYLYIFERV